MWWKRTTHTRWAASAPRRLRNTYGRGHVAPGLFIQRFFVGHPLIEEFCRIKGAENCRPAFFRRCQDVFQGEVQPMLDERDRLLEEVATLKAENERLKARGKRTELANAAS